MVPLRGVNVYSLLSFSQSIQFGSNLKGNGKPEQSQAEAEESYANSSKTLIPYKGYASIVTQEQISEINNSRTNLGGQGEAPEAAWEIRIRQAMKSIDPVSDNHDPVVGNRFADM